MSVYKKLKRLGIVKRLDWRPGEPISCVHFTGCTTADILLLESIGQETKIIYGNKEFGKKISNDSNNTEIWEYPLELSMTPDVAIPYIKSQTKRYQITFSAYTKKIWINPEKLLDASVKISKTELGLISLPNPRTALEYITDVTWTEDGNTLRCTKWENVALLLHQPPVAEIRKGVIILDQQNLGEAVTRLIHPYLDKLCTKANTHLKLKSTWPSRQLENLVTAKFRRAEASKEAQKREMPPCIKGILNSQHPLNYKLRFQFAEVLSYSSLEYLNEILKPREIIDGKDRHKNIRACFMVAKKKKADKRPCVTRTHADGLYCIFGGGLAGVKRCAMAQGFKGNIETVTISQMWGLQRH